MNFKKIFSPILALVIILSTCVACSRNDAKNEPSDNNGSTINGADNTTDKTDLKDSMGELKEDVKDTAEDIKDNLTTESDAGIKSDGVNNNNTGSAYNSQTSN